MTAVNLDVWRAKQDVEASITKLLVTREWTIRPGQKIKAFRDIADHAKRIADMLELTADANSAAVQ